MIITDKFVMINFPKTGSTFVRNVLKNIHTNHSFFNKLLFFIGIKKKTSFLNLWLPNLRDNKFRNSPNDEHGIYMQIPNMHQGKKIVSVKRNLFERYISVYEYGYWKKSPPIDPEILKKENKNFPNISFNEFVRLWTTCNPLEYHHEINRKLPIGPATSQFILFYFKEPFKVLKNIDEEYLNSDAYKSDIADIHFLDQNNLNSELYEFLLCHGYSENEIAFIKSEKPVNISTPKNRTIDDYYSNDLKDFVKEKEFFLFKIFNDYVV